MKLNNKDEVFKMIIDCKQISRNMLAENLNISKMAVSKIVKKLLENNLIIENEKSNSKKVGRKEKTLSVNRSNMGNILAIYFGLNNVKICVVDTDKKLILNENLEIKNFDTILEMTLKKIEKILKEKEIMIISIGMNGMVDIETGTVLVSTYYHWKDLPLKNIFEEKFKITTVIGNGVYLIALAQKSYNNENFVIINIENGVGAALYEKNSFSKKENFQILEIGHAPFNYSKDALICVCGNKGCIETLMSNWRIEEKVFLETGKRYFYDEIVTKANDNKSYFRNIILNIIEPLSHAILWINYTTSPKKIIITGKITKCEKFFWQELNRYVKNNLIDKDKELIIEKSKYDENIILTGAVQHAFNNLSNSQFVKNLFKIYK